jgi:hypothetical protein
MVVFAFQDANQPVHPTDVSLRFTPAGDFIVVEDAPRPRQSPRIAIRRLLGASRLTTSGCSRLRAQASELARVLATDPRRLACCKT